jgi:hypothetical protein
MYPPLFETVAADTGVQAQFGTAPTRVYPIEAPPGADYPYAVFKTIFGAPENNLSHVPDIDQWVVQVDVYAETISALRSAAESLRDALESVAHITAWNGEERDFRTKAFNYSFTVEFWENRDAVST